MTLSPYRIIYFGGGEFCEIMRGNVGWSSNRRCMRLLKKITYLLHQMGNINQCHIWQHNTKWKWMKGNIFGVSKILVLFLCYLKVIVFCWTLVNMENVFPQNQDGKELHLSSETCTASILPYRRICRLPWMSYSATGSLHCSKRISKFFHARFVS